MQDWTLNLTKITIILATLLFVVQATVREYRAYGDEQQYDEVSWENFIHNEETESLSHCIILCTTYENCFSVYYRGDGFCMMVARINHFRNHAETMMDVDHYSVYRGEACLFSFVYCLGFVYLFFEFYLISLGFGRLVVLSLYEEDYLQIFKCVSF